MAKLWAVLDGWKTRIWAILMFGLGLMSMLDPNIVSRALGLGDRGQAVMLVVFGIGTFVLREVTKTPPAPLVPAPKERKGKQDDA